MNNFALRTQNHLKPTNTMHGVVIHSRFVSIHVMEFVTERYSQSPPIVR